MKFTEQSSKIIKTGMIFAVHLEHVSQDGTPHAADGAGDAGS